MKILGKSQYVQTEMDQSSSLDETPCPATNPAYSQTDSPGRAAVDAAGLVERHYAGIYRYAYRLSGCAATAEDITQETFLQAIAHLDQLRNAAAEGGWLLAITRRLFIRWLRQVANPNRGRPMSLQNASAQGREPVEKASGIELLDDQDWVQASLSELGHDARIALLMVYFEEMSYGEIAAQLQIPIGTVMSRLSRGREQLRQALKRTAGLTSQGSADANGLLRGRHANTTDRPVAVKPLAREIKHG